MSEQMRAFALFVLGAVLCVVAIETQAFARPVTGPNRALLCAAFFGLPYLLWEFTRKINWWVVLYLAVLVPLVYYYLAYLAGSTVWAQMNESNAAVPAGVAGGLVGGALSLFTLKLGGLAGAATTRNALVGTAVLAVLGGVGAALAEAQVCGEYSLSLCLFLPWQIALGWFIAAMMRISPKRGEAAP